MHVLRHGHMMNDAHILGAHTLRDLHAWQLGYAHPHLMCFFMLAQLLRCYSSQRLYKGHIRVLL